MGKYKFRKGQRILIEFDNRLTEAEFFCEAEADPGKAVVILRRPVSTLMFKCPINEIIPL